MYFTFRCPLLCALCLLFAPEWDGRGDKKEIKDEVECRLQFFLSFILSLNLSFAVREELRKFR